MTIKIPIQADFDPNSIQQQIEKINKQIASMGAAVAKASGQKFEPITLKGKQDLDYFLKQSQQLLKIQGELNKRMNASDQGGKNPFEANWSKLYLNEKTRLQKMQEALVFMGASFEPGTRPSPPPRPSRPPSRPPYSPGGGGGGGDDSSGGGIFSQVAGGGLRAMGPAGKVAANALGTGMSMGAGAGLAGLLGGLGALAVGGLISAAKENLDKAEANAIAYDTLKRTLGDVNVSFNGLKSVIEGTSQNIKTTFDDTTKLATQFAKTGNVPGSQYNSLFGELQTGVGLSRSFGLDPSQGVGFLGTMRGMRLSQNEQDSRRFALLIGETIAKSNAFSKADEVMEAIAGFATAQTRTALGANVAGYAGQFSALASSGIPGLDPLGSASLLNRVNSALMGGGAKGEASQWLTGMIGARNGLDPFQLQVWREGGAFDTLSDAFGPGSIASRYGMSGPAGNQSFLGASLSALRGRYGNNKGMLAQATANHLGISMRQAMALLSVSPSQTGEMEQRLRSSGVDLASLNANGIGSLSKVMFGSDTDRQGVARELMSRTGSGSLSQSERSALEEAMSSGDRQKQTELLTRLVATRDQEQTQGKDIRDSKALIDNIKTDMASKLIPLTQEMRNGIMAIAGVGDNVSSQDIAERVMRADSGGRSRAIKGKYDRLIYDQNKRISAARLSELDTSGDEGLGPLERERNRVHRMEESRRIQEEANKEIARLEAEKAEKLKEENDALDKQIGELRKQYENSVGGGGRGARSGGGAHISSASFPTPAGGHGGLGGDLFSALLQQESGGQHTDANGNLIRSSAGAMGIAQLMPRTARNPGFGITGIRDGSKEENMRVGREYLNALLLKYGGDQRKALAAYNAGPGRVDSAIANYGDDWFSHMPAETRSYVPGIHARMRKGTPLPANGGGGNAPGFRIGVDPLEVIHRNDRGEQIGPSQTLATRLTPATPFGMGG